MNAARMSDPQRSQWGSGAGSKTTGGRTGEHPGKIPPDLRFGRLPRSNLELLLPFPFGSGDIGCHQVTLPTSRCPGFEGTVPGPVALLLERSGAHSSVGVRPPARDRFDQQSGVVGQDHQRLAAGNRLRSGRNNPKSFVLSRHSKSRTNSVGRNEHPAIGPRVSPPVTAASRSAVENGNFSSASGMDDVIVSPDLADDVDALGLPLVEPRSGQRIVRDGDHRHPVRQRLQVGRHPVPLTQLGRRAKVGRLGDELDEMNAAVIPRVVGRPDSLFEADGTTRVQAVAVVTAESFVDGNLRRTTDPVVHVPFELRSGHRQITGRGQEGRSPRCRGDLREVLGCRDHLGDVGELAVAGRDEPELAVC